MQKCTAGHLISINAGYEQCSNEASYRDKQLGMLYYCSVCYKRFIEKRIYGAINAIRIAKGTIKECKHCIYDIQCKEQQLKFLQKQCSP